MIVLFPSLGLNTQHKINAYHLRVAFRVVVYICNLLVSLKETQSGWVSVTNLYKFVEMYTLQIYTRFFKIKIFTKEIYKVCGCEWMDGWMEKLNRWIDGWMDWQTDGQINGSQHGWCIKDGWMDGRMDGLMDGLMDSWLHHNMNNEWKDWRVNRRMNI